VLPQTYDSEMDHFERLARFEKVFRHLKAEMAALPEIGRDNSEARADAWRSIMMRIDAITALYPPSPDRR